MKKMYKTATPLILLILLASFFAGCGIFEPADSQKATNSAPDTRIVASPRQSTEHSYFMPISWLGNDPDGYVVKYLVTVDGTQFETTKTDSAFQFSAANQDEQHSISVAAVDDDGAVDSTPAEVSFTAVNQAPDTEIQLEDDPPEGTTFGRAQTFNILATDPDNGPEFSYRWKIDDDGQWSEWTRDGSIEFFEGNVLPLGDHTFYAQARDAAMAVDETPATYEFSVSDDVQPLAVLTPTHNSLPFYPDSSVFYFDGSWVDPATEVVYDTNNVRFHWEVDASSYYGSYAAAKFQIDDNPETDWLSIQDTLFADLTPGSHTFTLRVKDTGGVESDPVVFSFQMVQPTFDSGILLVDDGNGRFSSDAETEQFYTDVMTAVGATFTHYDIMAEGIFPTPGKGLGNYSTVLWYSDEAFQLALQARTRLLKQYLGHGGNLWISGWKTLSGLAGSTPANFSPNAAAPVPNSEFGWHYLKIESTRQTPAMPFDFTGGEGQDAYPTINVDAAKNISPAFGNRLSPIDVLTVRPTVPEAQVIYTFLSATNNADFQGEPVGMKYLGDHFNVCVFGFPFYFMIDSEAIAAAEQVLADFGEI